MKHKVKIGLLGFLLIFTIINIAWIFERNKRFGCYIDEMEETIFSTFFVPRYSMMDKEGFTYGVKFPDYLTLTGNLSISYPPEEEQDLFTDGLIIWPLRNGNYEYGVILEYEGIQHLIYIDEDGSAVFDEDREVAEASAERIMVLLEKAAERWNLRN